MKNSKKGLAVCLLSGGLDSTTALYVAIHEGFHPLALTIDYGQLHKREIDSAKRITQKIGIDHEIISISLPWGGSSLIDSKISVPENRNVADLSHDIPNTYVPARNTIFLSFAASMAEANQASAIFIGANALDYSGYPDCRPEYLHRFEQLIKQGTKQGVEGKTLKIKAPLVHLKKSEIIKLAAELGAPLELTWSCYKGGEFPCQVCDSCLLRRKGFEEAGMVDPILNKEGHSSEGGNLKTWIPDTFSEKNVKFFPKSAPRIKRERKDIRE